MAKQTSAPTPTPSTEVFTATDLGELQALPQQADAPNNVRHDLVDLLASPRTHAALEKYQPFFTAADVDVAPALAALPKVERLRALEVKLSSALALVQRNLRAESGPVVDVSSDVHRLVAGTPPGSAMRDAFAEFLIAWEDTFRGGRPSKPSGSGNDPTKP